MKNSIFAFFVFFVVLSYAFAADPPVAPCSDDPNVLCRGTPDNPKVLGIIDVNEGDTFRACVKIFNCDVNEQLATRGDSVHYVRQITSPPGGAIVGPEIIDCNVGGAVDCRDGNGTCSYLYMEWPDTRGYGGRVFKWLIEIEERIDPGAEHHARGYAAVYINIRRAPPDFILLPAELCP